MDCNATSALGMTSAVMQGGTFLSSRGREGCVSAFAIGQREIYRGLSTPVCVYVRALSRCRTRSLSCVYLSLVVCGPMRVDSEPRREIYDVSACHESVIIGST